MASNERYYVVSAGPSPPGIIYTVRQLQRDLYHAHVIPVQKNLSQPFWVLPFMCATVRPHLEEENTIR